MSHFDLFQDRDSIDSIWPQIKSQKALFAQAYSNSPIIQKWKSGRQLKVNLKKSILIRLSGRELVNITRLARRLHKDVFGSSILEKTFIRFP